MSQNIFSLEGLISWLEMQPPETKYDYADPRKCLLLQYFKVRGVQAKGVAMNYWRDHADRKHDFPYEMKQVAENYPWTYAAALTCARELVRS